MKKLILALLLIGFTIGANAQNLFQINSSIDQPISCTGNNDASIQVVGYPKNNYSYKCVHLDEYNILTNNHTTDTNLSGFFPGLKPGHYLACGSLNGDGYCNTITIVEALPLNIEFQVNSSPSCTISDGSISAIITGGTAVLQPYLTTWTKLGVVLNPIDNFATTLDSITTGTYVLKLEDDNGCFYSKAYQLYYKGDINKDGNIDILDINLMEQDINNFVYGHNIITDLNGDDNVDLTDLNILQGLVNNFGCN